jgi:hypothetical protein
MGSRNGHARKMRCDARRGRPGLERVHVHRVQCRLRDTGT